MEESMYENISEYSDTSPPTPTPPVRCRNRQHRPSLTPSPPPLPKSSPPVQTRDHGGLGSTTDDDSDDSASSTARPAACRKVRIVVEHTPNDEKEKSLNDVAHSIALIKQGDGYKLKS